MRKFILAASIVFSNVATAGAASEPPQVIPASSGIITPNVATGYIDIDHVFIDSDGNMVGCQAWTHKAGPSRHTYPFCAEGSPKRPFSAFVPAGKQYVGFTPWLDGRVIIYWK